MTTQLVKELCIRYHLETQLFALEQQLRQLKEELPRQKFRQREAKVALLEYESGGLRGFLDKLSGKWEEKREILQREVRAAEAELSALTRSLEAATAKQESLCARLAPLRELGDMILCAAGLEREEKTYVLQLEAKLCTQKLIPALESNRKALEEAQEWARPNNRIDTAPGYTEGKLLAEAGQQAREAAQLLVRIAECGILLEIHPYFENPAGYISGVTRYAQLDRINRALAAIRQTERQARELLLQLPEDPQWTETE